MSNPSTQEAEGRRISSLKSAWGTCQRLFQNPKQKEDKKCARYIVSGYSLQMLSYFKGIYF